MNRSATIEEWKKEKLLQNRKIASCESSSNVCNFSIFSMSFSLSLSAIPACTKKLDRSQLSQARVYQVHTESKGGGQVSICVCRFNGAAHRCVSHLWRPWDWTDDDYDGGRNHWQMCKLNYPIFFAMKTLGKNSLETFQKHNCSTLLTLLSLSFHPEKCAPLKLKTSLFASSRES